MAKRWNRSSLLIRVLFGAAGASIVLLSAACLSTELIIVTDGSLAILDTPSDVDAEHAVCDPFANSAHPGAGLNHGVAASLRYIPTGVTPYNNVLDNWNHGTPLDATIFFGQLNVPTRKFDLGFYTEGGELLVNAEGNKLYEYFSLRFDSVIQLGETDEEGDYQFALLADDGAVMRIDRGNGWEVWVNNDGTHPTKLMGSSQRLNLRRGQRVPIRVDYYQGPRYHIALSLLWRKVAANQSLVEPRFGQSGNALFFDYNTVPSTPKPAYHELLARGWGPVPDANLKLPDAIASNPCTPAVQPLTTRLLSITPSDPLARQNSIEATFDSNYAEATFQCKLDDGALAPCVSPVTYSGLADGSHRFEVYASFNGNTDTVGATHSWAIDTLAPIFGGGAKSSTATSFTVTWTTNEPATSALNWGTGGVLDQYTLGSSELTTSHSVTVSGLDPASNYSAQIVSSDGAGNTYSSPRFSVRTLDQ